MAALQTVKMSLPVAPKRYGPGKKTYSDKDKNNGQKPVVTLLMTPSRLKLK